MRQNFSDEPCATVSMSPMRSSRAMVSGERCERLAATRSGAVAGVRVRSTLSCRPWRR